MYFTSLSKYNNFNCIKTMKKNNKTTYIYLEDNIEEIPCDVNNIFIDSFKDTVINYKIENYMHKYLKIIYNPKFKKYIYISSIKILNQFKNRYGDISFAFNEQISINDTVNYELPKILYSKSNKNIIKNIIDNSNSNSEIIKYLKKLENNEVINFQIEPKNSIDKFYDDFNQLQF